VGHNLRFGVGHDDLNMYETETHKNYLLNAAGIPVPTGPVIDYSIIQPHLPPVRRKISYLYAQDEWRFAPDWALTAGIRHDLYSDFGGTTNPRVALVWDASLDLTAKLLYGQAFRAPSFNEQYGTNPASAGNPNLLPETIRTLEAAFTWRARPDTEVNLNIFHYDAEDFIRSVPNAAPAPGATAANTGGQSGKGLELDVVWDARRDLRISGNYAYQSSIDEATHKDPGYAPHNHVYARGDWHFASHWLLSPQVNRVADRRRAAGDNRPQIPDYTTLDLTLHSKPAKDQWDFAFSIRNLLNADAREPSLAPGAIPNDLPVAPRTFYIQATYKM